MYKSQVVGWYLNHLEPQTNRSHFESIGGAKDIAPAALRQRGEKDFRFETVGHVDHNLRGWSIGPFWTRWCSLETLSLMFLLCKIEISSGWWFQPLWKILDGKDYPIYYGKQNMFQTTNQSCKCSLPPILAAVAKLGYTSTCHVKVI